MKIIKTMILLLGSTILAQATNLPLDKYFEMNNDLTIDKFYSNPYIYEKVNTKIEVKGTKLNLYSEIVDSAIIEENNFKNAVPYSQNGYINIFQKNKIILKLSYEKYYDKDYNLIRSQTMTSTGDIITCKITSSKNTYNGEIKKGFISKDNIMSCDNGTEELSRISYLNTGEFTFYSKSYIKNNPKNILEERTRIIFIKKGVIDKVKENIKSKDIEIDIYTK